MRVGHAPVRGTCHVQQHGWRLHVHVRLAIHRGRIHVRVRVAIASTTGAARASLPPSHSTPGAPATDASAPSSLSLARAAFCAHLPL